MVSKVDVGTTATSSRLTQVKARAPRNAVQMSAASQQANMPSIPGPAHVEKRSTQMPLSAHMLTLALQSLPLMAVASTSATARAKASSVSTLKEDCPANSFPSA